MAHDFGAVAIIGPAPPPYGGMALQGQALCENLQREDIKVVFVPTNPSLPWPVAKIKGLRTLLQSMAYCFQLAAAVPRVTVIHILAASYFYFFSRVAPAVLLGRPLGRRIIVNYRGGEGPNFLARYGLIARPILRLASVITVPSVFLARCFLAHGFTAKIVPNLVDLQRFKFQRRERLRPRFLVSRNLEPMYNVRMALEAFELVKRSHPDARIAVVGSGAEEMKLKSWVEARGLTGVFFHGAVENAAMPKYLSEADIMLNSSNVDNLPISLLEAFASGVAVVSTNVGGIPDLVGDQQAALLVEAGDSSEMARKVEWLLSDPDGAERIIAYAKQLSQSFAWPAVRKELLEVYYPDPLGIALPGAAKER